MAPPGSSLAVKRLTLRGRPPAMGFHQACKTVRKPAPIAVTGAKGKSGLLDSLLPGSTPRQRMKLRLGEQQREVVPADVETLVHILQRLVDILAVQP